MTWSICESAGTIASLLSNHGSSIGFSSRLRIALYLSFTTTNEYSSLIGCRWSGVKSVSCFSSLLIKCTLWSDMNAAYILSLSCTGTNLYQFLNTKLPLSSIRFLRSPSRTSNVADLSPNPGVVCLMYILSYHLSRTGCPSRSRIFDLSRNSTR